MSTTQSLSISRSISSSDTEPPQDLSSVASENLLHYIFENTVDRFPKNIAIKTSHFSYTYEELDRRANQISRELRARGVARGDSVGIMLPRYEHVYAVMLGILKAGAAYVPVDPDYPLDRAVFIATDSGAKFFITLPEVKTALKESYIDTSMFRSILEVDELFNSRAPTTRLSNEGFHIAETSLSYLIYTSGTTGRPKGCQIEHRNICALVRAESVEFEINSTDVVFQGFSLAFDASLEEIWAAFAHGATLFVGTKGIMQSGHFLANILAEAGVTVLSCVPTLLAMVDQDIPTVRILIFGGEVCPPDLIARWHHPARVIYNTYGPTEATVVATLARMNPDHPVTIGRPLANYSAFVVDEFLNIVPDGKEGELLIGGAGVIRGYLNRPDLNEQKFITSDRYTGKQERFYRTGDLVKLNGFGEYEFLGRADDQIKIRGFRVELSEIDSLLLQCPGVLAAAAVYLKDRQMIAAYVLPRDDASIDRTFIRNHLMSHLPVFMVPAFLDEVTAIPTLTSGKVDRKNLPAPKNRLAQESTEKVASANSLEELILKAWQQAFDREDLSVTENFFMDLGGHSLVAAQVTNILRAHQKFHAMSVADVYAFPTIRALANHRAAQGEDKYPSKPTRRSTFHASNRRYFICGFAQALGLVPIAGIYAWEWLGPYFVYAYLVLNKATTGQALAGALLTYFVTVPATMMIGVIAKWLILGRIKPGRYPLWGVYYYRFWFVRTLIRALPVGQLVGTPLLNFYYRLLGVKIGRGVYLGTANITSYDTVQVGKGTSIGSDASIDGTCVEDGWLKIRSVTIGNHCWLGHRTILGGNNKIDDGGQLDDLSSLPTGTHIGRGQKYSGSPAQHTGPSETSRRPAKRIWTTPATLALCVAIFSVPLMVSLSLAPGLLMMTYISHFDHWFHLFWGAPLAACSFVLCLCLVTIFVKWVMVGRLREGVYPIAGAYYVRKWFVDHVLSLSLDVIGTIYATLYIRPFFKLLGARLGARSEVSTVRSLQPDLLIAGPECFLADDISLGAPKIMSGWMELRQVQIGRRTFIGNSALLPAGSMIGDQILIGVLSRPPQQNPVPNGTSWLGASAILLPKREEAPQFSETQTYRPTGNLLALRYFIEFFRVILPSTLFIFVSALILHLIDHYHGIGNFGAHMLVLPFVYLAAGACGVLFVIALKWLLVGEYKPSKHPLWSHFVWRSELITGVYENFGVLFFLDLLRGTPFLPMTLRLFGMKIGSRCYLDTTWFTEFDLVFIGSDAMLNEDANIQTHLFEDRIFKLGKVKIGRRCSVGTMSTILYETEMKSGSKLGDLSLLMKGEMLPANTSWSGSPLQIE